MIRFGKIITISDKYRFIQKNRRKTCRKAFLLFFLRIKQLRINILCMISKPGPKQSNSSFEEESIWYHDKAAMMAKDWQKRASVEDHTKLTFDKTESWSLKYNLIWDRIWNSGLFEKEIYEKEIDYYLGKINKYGIPLDNRAIYTKSDWILWVVALSDDREKQEKFLKPLVKYLQETPSRNPFSDWFDTITACEVHFHNRTVQGGLFMPLLLQKRR